MTDSGACSCADGFGTARAILRRADDVASSCKVPLQPAPVSRVVMCCLSYMVTHVRFYMLQAIARACDFLLGVQRPDGGWAESYLSCQDKVSPATAVPFIGRADRKRPTVQHSCGLGSSGFSACC